MSGAASAIFLLDMKGRVLIWRDYRGDVSAPQAERAFAKLMDGEVWSLQNCNKITPNFAFIQQSLSAYHSRDPG